MKLWEEFLAQLTEKDRIQKAIDADRHADFQNRSATGEEILCSTRYGDLYKRSYIFRRGPVPFITKRCGKPPFKTPKAHRDLKYRYVCPDEYSDLCLDYNVYVSYERIARTKKIITDYDDIPKGSLKDNKKRNHWDKKNGGRYMNKYEKLRWSLCPRTLL